jgi:hypothetical protein
MSASSHAAWDLNLKFAKDIGVAAQELAERSKLAERTISSAVDKVKHIGGRSRPLARMTL